MKDPQTFFKSCMYGEVALVAEASLSWSQVSRRQGCRKQAVCRNHDDGADTGRTTSRLYCATLEPQIKCVVVAVLLRQRNFMALSSLRGSPEAPGQGLNSTPTGIHKDPCTQLDLKKFIPMGAFKGPKLDTFRVYKRSSSYSFRFRFRGAAEATGIFEQSSRCCIMTSV